MSGKKIDYDELIQIIKFHQEGYSYRSIGKFLNRNHGAIVNAINKYKKHGIYLKKPLIRSITKHEDITRLNEKIEILETHINILLDFMEKINDSTNHQL